MLERAQPSDVYRSPERGSEIDSLVQNTTVQAQIVDSNLGRLAEFITQPLERLSQVILSSFIGPYTPKGILIRILHGFGVCVSMKIELRSHLNQFSIASREELIHQLWMLCKFEP